MFSRGNTIHRIARGIQVRNVLVSFPDLTDKVVGRWSSHTRITILDQWNLWAIARHRGYGVTKMWVDLGQPGNVTLREAGPRQRLFICAYALTKHRKRLNVSAAPSANEHENQLANDEFAKRTFWELLRALNIKKRKGGAKLWIVEK